MRLTPGIAAHIVLVATALAAGSEPKTDREQTDFFERQIRPVLVSRCLSCHGEKKQESGLRLDSRAAVLRGGNGGAAVISGKPRDSRLIHAVRYESDDLQMPPNKKLSDSEIESLVRWVELGLPWPDIVALDNDREPKQPHWAFEPLRQPTVPQVGNAEWGDTAIDRFILARLKAKQIAPSPPANRRTLIRRMTFDLHGLPPTPDEVQAFVNDTSSDALARLIDRLLASPKYGERWGRHWLDVARYADNKGHVFFEDKKYPWAYTYRDYVIRALNEDLPYDQFIREQIAADQLDLGDDKRPLAAMGFLTLGGRFMNNTHDIIDDRIDVVTRGIMGVTVTCARCHDHKYDPIPQADYYSLYGVFRSSYEPTVHPLFQPPPKTDEYLDFAAEMEKREKALVDFVTAKHRELVTGARKRVDEYLKAAYARRGVPAADDFMLVVEKGDINPAMILRWQRYLENPHRSDDEVWLPWRELSEASAETFSQEAAKLAPHTERADDATTVNPILRERLADSPPKSMDDLADLYAAILREVNAQWLAELKQAKEAGLPAPKQLADDAAEQLRQTMYGPNAPPDAPLMLDWGFLSLFPDRPTQEEYKNLLKAVEEWSATGAGAPPRAMVLYDAETPYEPRIFQRGQPTRLGAYVPRQFLEVAAADRQPFQDGSGRLELAEAIVDPRNPLTARVIVNRVWLHHFGQGFVTTPSDFGVRSDPPSHPELLDYLAMRFMDGGWSMKELLREIVTSATYRQSSQTDSERLARDPDNRLFCRGPRFRLEAEMVRDTALATSGLLSAKMYGKSVMPPQPEGVWQIVYSADKWETSMGEDRYRRGLYTFWRRTSPYPAMMAFDATSREVCTVRRIRTNTPLAALVTLNDPAFVEAAQVLARDTVGIDSEAIEDQITYLFRRCLVRPPRDEELQSIASLYQAAFDHYSNNLEAAGEMAGVVQNDSATLASWTVIGNMLLNLDETLTKG